MSSMTNARAANLFDIRRIIAAVFTLYGLVLLALGLFGAQHIKDKASGINVNLWTGIGMLVVAALMLAWSLWRPVVEEPEAGEPAD
jgi:xanthine/uracil/vitamin C permease (AzgA family)